MFNDTPGRENFSSDVEKNIPLPRRNKSTASTKPTCSFVVACYVGVCLLIYLIISQNETISTDIDVWPEVQGGSRVIAGCGMSPEEAKEKGCVWDLMSYGWTHPACYNKAESEKWLAEYGPWKWYNDLNATEPIADEDLPNSWLVYAEQGYHVQHCLYILKLIHLAAMSGHLVTDEAIPLAHTGHCTKMMSSPKYLDFKHTNTKRHSNEIHYVSQHMCTKNYNRYTRCNHSVTTTAYCVSYLSKSWKVCEKSKARDTYFSLCPRCRGADESQISGAVGMGSGSGIERERDRVGSPASESTTGWSRTTAVESMGVPDPVSERISERVSDRISARVSQTSSTRDAGIRIEVIDGGEERVDAQGLRERAVAVVDRALEIPSQDHSSNHKRKEKEKDKEKKRGLRRIVGGMGFGIGMGGKKGKEKVNLKDVVDVAIAKEREDMQAREKEKEREEAHARAAIRWAQREREIETQVQGQAHAQIPIRTAPQSSWVEPEMGPELARQSLERDTAPRTPHGYRPPIRSLSQTSWTEPGQETEREKQSFERHAGGSLGRIHGGMDERDGHEREVGSLGVRENGRRDGDTATILTTWFKVLPRTVTTSSAGGTHSGSQRKQKLQDVVEHLRDERGGEDTKSHFEDSRARLLVHPGLSQDRIGESPIYEGNRVRQGLRESEMERMARELKAADARLTSVRDGRGSIEWNKNQKDGNRIIDTP
ncbi:hypothetical protein IFR05_010792 [Cadophora sp. M221]|nr:hypothetical protein IFR05_010792 [Cadophora sp. M221]